MDFLDEVDGMDDMEGGDILEFVFCFFVFYIKFTNKLLICELYY